MSILVSFAMFPTDKGDSVSPYVSRILKMFKESDVDYKLSAMGTVFETETMSEALHVINKAYDLLEDCSRVYSVVNIDARKDKPKGRIKAKIDSIQSNIGEVKQ